jgi:hypothetical protein
MFENKTNVLSHLLAHLLDTAVLGQQGMFENNGNFYLAPPK